jgi:dTDP-glucose pyrophosphorylase
LGDESQPERYPKAAVLLAAGCGARLLPHTRTTPKPLLSVDGRPVIDRVFLALKATKIRDVVVVTGYLEPVLISYVSEKYSRMFRISFVTQVTPRGTADAVLRSTQSLQLRQRDTVLVAATDYLMHESYLSAFADFHCAGTHDISLSLRWIPGAKGPESSHVIINEQNEVIKIVEKPASRKTAAILAASLLYVVPGRIVRYLKVLTPSARGEYELPEAVNLMIDDHWIARGLVQEELPDWETHYR